jgi:hypothetical protein
VGKKASFAWGKKHEAAPTDGRGGACFLRGSGGTRFLRDGGGGHYL